MKNKTLVFTATYNESDNIKEFLDITLKLKNIDLLIIDDNSPDLTFEVVEHYQKKYQNLFLIKRKAKLGLDTAHKLSFEFAKKNNYQNLITLDADLSHDPNQIKKFISNLESYPFVIGSRYIHGGKNNMKLSRLILSYFGNKFIKFILKIPCDEFTTSYRGFNLNKLNQFNINDVKSKGYSFFMETIFWINKKGYEIKQLPIIFEDRFKGKSKISKIESFRTLKNLFIIKTRY
tara:strand:+ start:332 stop:1030 length:699 start_codon:yes stop_codon:yes gene_type:complete